MKKNIISLTVLLLMSCVTPKTMNQQKLKYNCPEDGTCSLVVHQNKSLDLKKDDLGKIYYHLSENQNVTTYIYEYQRKIDTTLQDASYKEEILFELKNDVKYYELKNEELNKIKLLMGRHLFERSNNVGYFEIKNGNFQLKNNQITINIETEKPFLIKKLALSF